MKQRKSVLKLLGSIFTIIAVIIGGIATALFILAQNFYKDAVSTTGFITNIYGDNAVEITYQTLDTFTTYTKKLNFYSSSMDIGDNVTVYYKPSHPSVIHMKLESYLASWILYGMAALFLILGLLFILIECLSKRKMAALKETGRLIYAQVTDIKLNYSIRVNGRNPYFIECKYYDAAADTYYIFKSKSIWFNPSEFLQEQEIGVYVDPSNYKKYYVDTSSLEERVKVV